MASAPLPDTLSIKIPAVQVSEHVTFQIFVTRADLVWSVRRRYQEFVKLNDSMKRVLPPGQLPELPAKTFRMGMSKFEPNFIEARRQKLEEYLTDLIAAVPPERIDALDDFLAYSEHCLLEMVEHLGACVVFAARRSCACVSNRHLNCGFGIPMRRYHPGARPHPPHAAQGCRSIPGW